ncbi:thiamine transport system ATP-binding protein [Georgenia satyanarayanai]|uniref:ABC-type quaternary amine transporter n=1 Tax=Georgenia satyanarayanai TaxID=860221 RepID=A0A2Y9AJ14_9MICO|nr:ABC transporter ATP-binding protein [Georgenia satyanarayanai]PYF99084.1 thiamine transport system ATP-binding protein [Georgenia satyanarayanai]SSA44046.1 thiamine transport system ATP-binding protein [Georgenia satyanarayanai]
MVNGLEVREAVLTYPGGPTAVDGVSLELPAGEVLALLGPSGCGKSSLLRAVAGLEPLTSGQVRWGGDDLAGVPVHRRGFGLMFQDGQLFPHRDVAGNIAYGIAGLTRAERAARVAELLRLVGLRDYGARAVTTLSGGEQQRVALARALAPRPRLLLLDEPLSSLDRSLREHLAGELRDIIHATGTTAVYVTHDHDEAFTVASRIAVMSRGRVLQADTPERLWRAPASEEVARFLGYGPVVDAVVADGQVRGPLGAVADWAGGVGGEVRLALGPRALVPDDDGEPVPVRGWRVRRGERELDVTLPDGQGAVVRVPADGAVPRTARVRVATEHVAVVPR